jgi:hypothetical protein
MIRSHEYSAPYKKEYILAQGAGMDKRKTGRRVAAIECLASAGTKPVTLYAQYGRLLLPGDPASEAGPVTYGQYMGSVERFFCKNSYRALKNLLKKEAAPAPALESATAIELISEKHGALYSVLRLRLRFADHERSFAVNCAFSPEQQAFLQVEARLLARLNSKSGLSCLPAPLLFAKTCLLGHPADAGFMLLVTGWFEDHHEFHLSPGASGVPSIRLWDPARPRGFLSPVKSIQLYEQACRILTSYLDVRSFSQIYPWHHAAGDFIADVRKSPPSLKLITVRGYRSLLAAGAGQKDKMLGALHFFANMAVRMRIDRLDGTGELAWAGRECLPGVVRGFAGAWEVIRSDNGGLPKASEIFSLFLDLSPDERLAFTEIAAKDGRVEAGEGDFLRSHLPRHVFELSDALGATGPPAGLRTQTL